MNILPLFSFLIIAAVCWSRSFAGDVQSPPSLEGASLEIHARKEEYKNLHHEIFLNLKDGLSWEGSEDKIVTYKPKGKTAHIIVAYCDKRKENHSSGEMYEKDPSLFRHYYLSGEQSYEKAKGKNPKPATITFTDKGGYCYYKGILQGYLTCDQKQEAENLTGIPVTIMLDGEKTPDPELTALLGQLDSGKLTGRQANWVRQELLGYWTERLHKAHSALMEHYSHAPAIAKKLKAAQKEWESFQDSLREAYAACLMEEDEREQNSQWFLFNMLRLDCGNTERHCRTLEELLDIIKMNGL